MNCPIDNTTLVITDRQGIEIDYCPKCRGVWLDRGELDKIIERMAGEPGGRAQAPAAPAAPAGYERQAPPPAAYPPPRREHYDDDDDGYGRRDRGHSRKRRSFLDDIFDFD